MSANPLPAQTSTSPLGRNRSSLLSKFRSQLGQRNRAITDFYIEPDDPWRSYFPGDVIKGTVSLTVVRPVRITHLVISLHGIVKVFKNNVPAGENPPDVGSLGPGRGRRGAEYLGNGVATLFEDEVVLCGEGRLKEGIYKFRFEMSFPPYALPSSISFERGTISYMLTSTLTKPTTINPTLSCRRRINLLESIDIAGFPAPKPRVVTLEPISKRSKQKGKTKPPGSDAPESASLEPSASGGIAVPEHRPPLSPAPSNVSSSSRLSNSSQSFQIVTDPGSAASSGARNSEGRSITPSVADGIITAKAEVLRAGVLPGDTLPIKITINHTRQVRSAHGIIITLYRSGRIDLHPAIPMGSTANGKKLVYEDYYPRSRTGLGGLTIGTSRASSTFRKDLSQTFAPLIVDPTTLTADIKTSIRIPEDAFPTITRTPGSMINFRYYVEVVVDLRGKLTSPERFLPRFNLVSSGRNFSSNGKVVHPADTSGSAITANWGDNILDTDQIRREKGVVAVVFEVVIGTQDTQRRKSEARRTSSAADVTDIQQPVEDGEFQPSDTQGNTAGPEPEYAPPENAEWRPDQMQWPDYSDHSHPDQYPFPPADIPSPQPDEPTDEKARLRHAERMLLPSQPPGEEAGPSSAAEAAMPTAPVLPDDDQLNDYHHLPSPGVNSMNGMSPALMSAESVQTVIAGSSSAPLDSPSRPSEDDKQELERQRLMMEASAPNDPDAGPNEHTDDGPSAPVFRDDDDDQQLVGGAANGDELLPRYQR
ncbi:pH response protein PalF [Aspergillus mulundensis]|uniref:pH-response regulator protein palF n=1 Tax=Aspergillus mulundensis TaxID=1810919 RepID=A0A3D8S4W4_9EURO|nr:pH-response regulator protein palF [Aspergillus mulundensis]RDW81240.1 pH-response regulator protein palF [Aspergillus mulundensis]